MSGIDFKVDNYSIEDLLEIFGITTALPQNEIIERGSGMIEKYRQQNKPNYVQFFSKATTKLLSNYRKVEEFFGNISDLEDEQEGFVGSRLPNTSNPRPKNMLPAENVWQHNQSGSLASHQKNRYEGRHDLTHVPTNLDHSVQLRKNLALPNAYSQVPFAQGTMNPTLQNTYLTWVNVDSQFRDITSTTRQSTSCGNQVISRPPSSIQQGNATDFIFTLNEPITNVLSMSLGSLELPLKGYYVFSNSKGNTTFDIKFTWGDIGYLQNNEDFATQLDGYIKTDPSQVYIRTGSADEYNPCMPSLTGVCACIGAPCSHDSQCKFFFPPDSMNVIMDCSCNVVDGHFNKCSTIFKPPSGVYIPPYNGPWYGYPETKEQLIERWGNFGYFISGNNVKNLYVPMQMGEFHCAQLPQGNYQNSTSTKLTAIEDYLTLAMQGIVGPQARPTNPMLTNIWTPDTSDTNSKTTFIKSFISKGSGKPFFSINGSFDWWINQTLPLCVPTASFLRAPRIGMAPPGFGGGLWSPWMQGNTDRLAQDVGANYYTLGTPVPCKFDQRMKALTPKEIWGRVGKQYTGGQQAANPSNESCRSGGGTPSKDPPVTMANTPPASIGFNLLDMDIFGRFIYYWNEIVCNWAHTNVYDLFVLGPSRWRKIDFTKNPPKTSSELVFGGTNNSWSSPREPWIFARNEAWQAKNYIDQLPLTFEQFLHMQSGYENITIASKSGGVGYWNVSSNDVPYKTTDPSGAPHYDLSGVKLRPAMYGSDASGVIWPFVIGRPIGGSGWQHGLDPITTEGYWHNKDNFDPQDLSWQQQCTNAGGWFGIGGEIPYPATTYVRGCPPEKNRSESMKKSCVMKCANSDGGKRDDKRFPYPYGPSYYALDSSNNCWNCSTVGAGKNAAKDVSGTLSEIFAHCLGTTWTRDCSNGSCCHPQGTTGGIWCAQSAVGSGLPAAPQTNIHGSIPEPRTQWSNGLIPPFSLNQVQTYVLYYIDKVLIPMAAENREQIWNANHYPAKMPPTLIALMIKTTRQWLWLGGVRQQAFQKNTKKYKFPLILPWPFPFCHGFPNYIHPPITWMTQSTFNIHTGPTENSWYSAAKSLTRPFTITSPGFLPHLPRFDIQWYNPCDPLGGSCGPPTCAKAPATNQNKSSSARKQNGSLGWNLGFTDFKSSSGAKFFEGDFANGTYPDKFVEHSILQTGVWGIQGGSTQDSSSQHLPTSAIFKPYVDISGQEWTINGAPPWIYLQLICCMTDKEKEEWTTERIANAALYGEKLGLGEGVPISIFGSETTIFDALAPGKGPGGIITNEINPSPWGWDLWSACGISDTSSNSTKDIIAHCIRDASWARCMACEGGKGGPKDASCCDSSNNCTCDISGNWQILGVHPRYCNKTGRFESGGPPWPWAWPADLQPPNTCRDDNFWTTHNTDPSSNNAFLEPWSTEWIQKCFIPGWTYYKLCPTSNSTAGKVCMTDTVNWGCDPSCSDVSNCYPRFPLTIPAPTSNKISQLVPLYAPEINISRDLNQIPTSNCNAVWMGITSNRVVNLNGTNYVTLIIDEFNKNRYVGNMPGLPLPSSQQHFKTPSYAKRITSSLSETNQIISSFPVCTIPPICCPSGNTFALTGPQITINESGSGGAQRTKRAYRKGTHNPHDIIDGNNNITKAQKFTALQIANHQAQKLLNQHLSPNLSNVLIRLPLERWQMSQGGQLVLMPPYNTSSGGRGMGRRYYGPVTIKRLHVKIVDDHGDTLDLTQGNVSFSLLLERLYQY